MVKQGYQVKKSTGIPVVLMILCDLFGSKINPKLFIIDRDMYKVKGSALVMIVIILMLFSAIYIKFW